MSKNGKKQTKSALKWLFYKSKKQWFNIVLLILANSFFSILSVAFAYAVKMIIDGATMPASNSMDKNQAIMIGAIAIGIIVILQFVFRFICNGLTEHIKGKLEILYKTHIFNQILQKKYNKITQFHSGELLNRLSSDVSVCSENVTAILPTSIAALVRLIVAIIALCLVDSSFAIIFVTAGLTVAIVMSLIRGKLKSLHKEIQTSDGKVRSFMQESIENILSIKTFSAENSISEKSSKLQQKTFVAKMKRKNFSVAGTASHGLVYSAGYVFALVFGAIKIASGVESFSYGSLSAVLQLVNNVQIPFSSLSTIMPKYYSMTASAERLMEIEEIEDDLKEKTDIDRSIYKQLDGIEIKDLNFVYDRDVVFSNANAYIQKGKFTVISGRSGIGKSTLFKLFLGVYDYDGQIVLNTLKRKILLNGKTTSLFSYVPQGNTLFSGTIRENITFLNENYTNEQIENALSLSLCNEFIETFPDGINTIIGENGVGLSEGQIQRLTIARSILIDAPIMLLDEATSALDNKTEERLLRNLYELKGKTIIFITHKSKAMEICDHHLIIKNKTFEMIK